MIAEEFSVESVLTVAGTFAVGVAICLAWLSRMDSLLLAVSRKTRNELR